MVALNADLRLESALTAALALEPALTGELTLTPALTGEPTLAPALTASCSLELLPTENLVTVDALPEWDACLNFDTLKVAAG